jgi:hypothetical protein
MCRSVCRPPRNYSKPKLALHGVIDFLRRHALVDVSNGVLLKRYLIHSRNSADGDPASSATKAEDAFAELVRRHGPKVYGVCRRILGDHQLAEDAFQATFVVLARKARTIQPPSAVGGFLYGVARKAGLFQASFGLVFGSFETRLPLVSTFFVLCFSLLFAFLNRIENERNFYKARFCQVVRVFVYRCN